MGSGRPRTPHELAALLRQAGFAQRPAVPTAQPLLTRFIVAQRDEYEHMCKSCLTL